MGDKIYIESLVPGRIGVTSNELRLVRRWEKKGSQKAIDSDIMEELIYDNGFDYMIRNGMLGFVKKEDEIRFGYSSEEHGEPELILDDFKRKRLMTVAPMEEFKETIAQLSYEQKMQLADFAIENGLTDFERSEIIKQATGGKDIVKSVQLASQNKED